MNQNFHTIAYKHEEKEIKAKVDIVDGSAWLSKDDMSKLFGRDRSVITRHIKNIYASGGLSKGATCARFAQVQTEGERSVSRQIDYYSIDVIITVGRRLRSERIVDTFIKYIQSQFLTITENHHPIMVFNAGTMSVDVLVSPEEETVWLTQNQIAELFETPRQNVSYHIANILEDGEMDDSVRKESLHTASDGKSYLVTYYNLDMILSVGYRVKSQRAIEFRRWATSILKKHLIKGYSLNEKRLEVYGQSIADLSQRVLSIEAKVDKQDEQAKRMMAKFETLANLRPIPEEKIIYEGEYFSGREFFRDLFGHASKSIKIIDLYADSSLLSLLTGTEGKIDMTIIKGSSSKLTKIDINAYNLEYGRLTVKEDNSIHDRYIFIDDADGYHMGGSFNQIGKKLFEVIKIFDQDILAYLLSRIDNIP